MPSVLEDPDAPVVYRTSGNPPFLTHLSPLPVEIVPRQVTLKDRITAATLVPFSSPDQVGEQILNALLSRVSAIAEISGDCVVEKPPQWHSMQGSICQLFIQDKTMAFVNSIFRYHPLYYDPMTVESFAPYWFGNFGAIMLLGEAQSVDDLLQTDPEEKTWQKHCLGSFYIKPNYPGRSSHVCNGGFLVSDLARNRGVGRLMGEGYLEWAPKLGYSYSVFNLVYETNVASCRIWDSLGFKRIGRVKGCGNLRSFPDQLVDAIQYGRELGPEGEEYASEERFDKIRYYLKHGKYPEGADRAEKSRLRSAATHYRLAPSEGEVEEKLMLKDKEVVSSPDRQYEIAAAAHGLHHAGINKTTALVAEKYHWTGIKTSVSLAIKDCIECARDPPKSHFITGDETRTHKETEIGSEDGLQPLPGLSEALRPSTSPRNVDLATNEDDLDGSNNADLAVDPQLIHNLDDAS